MPSTVVSLGCSVVASGSRLCTRATPWLLLGLGCLGVEAWPQEAYPWGPEGGPLDCRIIVCDASSDRIVSFVDVDASGGIELESAGEVTVLYDDASPGPDLSTPSDLILGPSDALYLIDGGTLDQVLRLVDQNGDGDSNDAGEVSVFYDSAVGDVTLATPNTIVAASRGGYYVSDDGSRAHRIVWLGDVDGNGTANDPGEARIVYDESARSTPFLPDIEALAAAGSGRLYAADATLQAIYMLEDLDGDGTFLGANDVRLYYRGHDELVLGDVETLVVIDDDLFAFDRATGRVVRLRDENFDGDADDDGEASAFIDETAVVTVSDITAAAPLPGGGFAFIDNERDAVVLAKDLDGDGAALGVGEIVFWTRDQGETLALPTGLLVLEGSTPTPPVEGQFVRGDSTADGILDVSDPIASLGFLFLGADLVDCDDALDADDDGDLNISDPISLLNYLFLGASPPPAPFPEVGSDPTPDGLDCAATSPGGNAHPR